MEYFLEKFQDCFENIQILFVFGIFQKCSETNMVLKKMFRNIKIFLESVLELIIYPETVYFPKCSRTFLKF